MTNSLTPAGIILRSHLNVEPAQHRPFIIIEGQPLYVAGNAQSDPASDFADGVKTGPVDYDQRLHTFFVAVDDNSGGHGFDRVSLREDVGLYARSVLGVDSRRSKHLHAPPHIQKLFSYPASVLGGFSQDRSPITGQDTVMHVGENTVLLFPAAAFRTTDGREFTRAALTGNAPSKLVRVFSGLNTGLMVWYANFLDGNDTDPDLASWRSADGVTWVAQTKFAAWDVMYYQGIFWTLGQNGVSLSFAYPTSSSATQLPPGYGQFIGPGVTPTGDQGMYMIKAGRVFYAVKARNHIASHFREDTLAWTFTPVTPDVIEVVDELVIAPGYHVAGACFFGNSIMLTNGFSVLQLQISGRDPINREVGFETFRSSTPEIENGTIRAMTADAKNLYVGVQQDATLHVCCWNERGWCLLGSIPAFYIQNMGIGWVPADSWPLTKRAIYLLGSGSGGDDEAEIVRPTGNGAFQQWTGDFTAVDDVTSDDDSTFIQTPGTGQVYETYTHPALSVPVGKVLQSITIRIRAKRLPSGAANYPILIALYRAIGGGIRTFSKTMNADGSYTNLEETFNLDPYTGLPWVAADFNNTQFGVINGSSNLENQRVTQIYAEARYVNTDCIAYEMHLPTYSNIPVPGFDRFARTWDLYSAWMDGGFIDLRGALYEFLASGQYFTDTEYIEVYYSIDGAEVETLLGVINEETEDLHFGLVNEGVEFRSFRLHLVGYAGVPDEQYEDAANGDTAQTIGNAAAQTKVSQSFIAEGNTAAEEVLLMVRKVGSPTDDLTISIEADSGGNPSGTVLSLSSAHNGASLETDYGWRSFQFGRPPIEGGDTYHFVVQRSGAVDAVNYYEILTDSSSPGYAGGEAKRYTGAAWVALGSDFIFRLITDKRLTADLQGYVVNYNKRPPYRAQWQFPLDVDAMIEDKLRILGEEANPERIMDFLVDLWNQKKLVRYEVPGVRDGLMLLTAMPISVEVDVENRPRMQVQLQVLEVTHNLVPDTAQDT